jgi:Carboxypeptidase regulatory-like domain
MMIAHISGLARTLHSSPVAQVRVYFTLIVLLGVMMAQISGIVRDSHGNPVAQARVYFTGGPEPWPDIAALTDNNGAFSLPAPSPGTYTIECVAEGFAPVTAAVTVMGSQEVQLQITLR